MLLAMAAVVIGLLAIMSVSAFAASVDITNVTVSEPDSEGLREVTVTYTATDIDGDVTILAVPGVGDTMPTPTDDNIIYIDQQPATETSFTFLVDDSAFDEVTAPKLFVKVGGTDVEDPDELIEDIFGIVIYGDVNGDGDVNAADASLVLQHFVGSITPFTGNVFLAADVNNDGDVNAADASLILQYFVGSITKFPVEELPQ